MAQNQNIERSGWQKYARAIELPYLADIDTFLDATGIDDGELHLRELLAEQRAIGLVYNLEDVNLVNPNLDDDQAWAVLQAIDQSIVDNPELGMTHDTIRYFIEEMFPDVNAATRHDGDDV